MSDDEMRDLWRRANDAALSTQQDVSVTYGRLLAAHLLEEHCSLILAADDKASESDYMLDSDDCIAVLRGTWELA